MFLKKRSILWVDSQMDGFYFFYYYLFFWMVFLVPFGDILVALVSRHLGLKCPRWPHSYFCCLGRATRKAGLRWDPGMSRIFSLSLSPCCLRTLSSPGGLSCKGVRFLTWQLRASKRAEVQNFLRHRLGTGTALLLWHFVA